MKVTGFPDALLPALTAIAAASVALAAADQGGTLTTNAIVLLALGVGTAILGVLVRSAGLANGAPALLSVVLLGCCWAQATSLGWSPIDWPTDGMSRQSLWLMRLFISGGAVLTATLCAGTAANSRWALPAILGLQGLLGVLLIRGLERPGIDVLMFQEDACAALVRGINPWSITFADPFPAELSPKYYGTGISVDGVLQFGYPYMPITLLMALPGHVLGDVRYAGLAAAVLAAALIGFARIDRAGKAPAALFAFSPIAPLVMAMGWNEPYVVLLGAGVFGCIHRAPRLLPYAVGLFLVGKQYMPALAPLALLLLPRPWTIANVAPFVWRGLAAAAAVTLPFVLWDPPAFWNSALTLQLRHPFRPDALSFMAWASPADPGAWIWVPFAALGLAMAGCLLAAPHRRLDFFTSTGLALLVFFSVNRQAFANYYSLACGLLWLGVAHQGLPSAPTDAASPASGASAERAPASPAASPRRPAVDARRGR
jgi:hypothetical protein